MRLTDLGLAYVSESKAPLAANGLYCYLPCGTPFYAAPEMINLKKVNSQVQMGWKYADPDETEGRNVFYGPKLDWYSFGLVLYEMVATFFQDPDARKAQVSLCVELTPFVPRTNILNSDLCSPATTETRLLTLGERQWVT